jgi:hypothetical protein
MELIEVNWFIEIIGWIGSIEILLAYGLNSYQRIKSDSRVFQILNLTGGIFLIAYSVYKGAFANAFINIVWVIIAIIAIGKVFVKR